MFAWILVALAAVTVLWALRRHGRRMHRGPMHRLACVWHRLKLDSEQKQEMKRIKADLRPLREEWQKERQQLRILLAEVLKEPIWDENRLREAKERFKQNLDTGMDKISVALSEFHGVLRPEQRLRLAEALSAPSPRCRGGAR